MCQYKLNIKISTFDLIYCYVITNEGTIDKNNSGLVVISVLIVYQR